MQGTTGPEKKYLTYAEAAATYAVSIDWLRRNKAIVKMKDGRKMTRISVASLDNYFRLREG